MVVSRIGVVVGRMVVQLISRMVVVVSRIVVV